MDSNFEFRKLTADDLFPMFNILSKIGIKELKSIIPAEAIKGTEIDNKTLGMSVIIDATDMLLSNLPKCKQEIYSFLASLSGKDVQEIADLEISVFAEMIIELVKKEEFKNFFKVVSKLFK